MIHRHLDYPSDTPVDQLGPAAIDDLLDRGDLDDWAPLARAVAGDPWGRLADTILRLCEAHPMYGTSALWFAYIATCRAKAGGGGQASWPNPPSRATLPDVRRRSRLSQGALGERLGMNQSQVSRLERREDLRVSTLRRYVEAAGGRLRLLVDWPEQPEARELTIEL